MTRRLDSLLVHYDHLISSHMPFVPKTNSCKGQWTYLILSYVRPFTQRSNVLCRGYCSTALPVFLPMLRLLCRILTSVSNSFLNEFACCGRYDSPQYNEYFTTWWTSVCKLDSTFQHKKKVTKMATSRHLLFIITFQTRSCNRSRL